MENGAKRRDFFLGGGDFYVFLWENRPKRRFSKKNQIWAKTIIFWAGGGIRFFWDFFFGGGIIFGETAKTF